MKKYIFRIFLFLILFSGYALAQKEQYPTKKIGATEYYIYTVQPHEGLYAISHRFGVTQADINNANRQIEDGLKAGQEILIPVKDPRFKQTTSKSTTVKSEIVTFKEHKVEHKQTLFAISRMYNVSQDDIRKYNPELSAGLKEGMILKIPLMKKDSFKPAQNTFAPKKNIIHEVQEGETLYSIAKKYNVSLEDVIRLNPGSDQGIGAGTKLIIPFISTLKSGIKQEKESVSITTPVRENRELVNGYKEKSKSIRIAVLLPFMLNQAKNDVGTDRFLDFYGGILIAMKEAKRKGLSVELFTYDTEKSEDKLAEILNNPELKTMNLIIGPAYSNQVAQISDFAINNKINTLIPFSSKVPDIASNPYLFQFNPGNEAEIRLSTELLDSKLRNYNIVFAGLLDADAFDEGRIWSERLQQETIRTHKAFSQIMLISPDNTNFKSVLKKNEKNLIIFNSDKYVYAEPYIRQLQSLEKQYNIVLLEPYSWLNQSTKLEHDIYISPFSPEINPVESATFETDFLKYFGRKSVSENPRFDLLGYDLTTYFLTMWQRFGPEFIDHSGTFYNIKWLQSQIRFERISKNSGFINHKLYIGEETKQ